MCTNIASSSSARQTGLTLVEVIIFLIILSVGVVGLLGVMNSTAKYSADPMIRKQALAIAESLLEEVELQPFTYCDPDDPDAPTAKSSADCKVQAQGLGPTPAMTYKDPDSGIQVNLPAETRYAEPRFDNVGDYHGLTMNEIPPPDKGATGIRAFNGDGIGGLGNYKAVVSVAQDTRGGIPAPDSLRIDVTITPPSGDAITLTGYRFRYAPRAVP